MLVRKYIPQILLMYSAIQIIVLAVGTKSTTLPSGCQVKVIQKQHNLYEAVVKAYRQIPLDISTNQQYFDTYGQSAWQNAENRLVDSKCAKR